MTAPTDNQALRALFTLPPIQPSRSTALVVPETPAPKVVTGDRELDAVLWLRDCIKTAHPVLIEKALEAFKAIKTPASELEKRYTAHVARVSNGHFGAVLGTFGFASLDSLAKSTMETKARQNEALARFGSERELFAKTSAEKRCERALRGLKRDKAWREYDAGQARERFDAVSALKPHTLADVLHVQAYGDQLYWLRHAVSRDAGDHWPAFQAHDDYTFAALAWLAPQSKDESLSVLKWLTDNEKMDRSETEGILCNLVAGGWE